MKKTLFLGTIIVLLFSQCSKGNDPFLIKKGSVGGLTQKTVMKQVDSIFAEDSIVALNPVADVISTQGDVEVFENGGSKLLLISPNNENDPESVITNIQIFDDRFKTEKGLSKSSTFKDVKDNYTIADIQSIFGAVVIFLENSDVYITIDNKQLPENLRYDPSVTIEASHIPDEATFKYFMVGWDIEQN